MFFMVCTSCFPFLHVLLLSRSTTQSEGCWFEFMEDPALVVGCSEGRDGSMCAVHYG